MTDPHLNSDDDCAPYETDENGCPTPAQVRRWRELDAAAAQAWVDSFKDTLASEARDMAAKGLSGPQLISVDELRAAGALDCPPEWRKSLSAGCKPAPADDEDELPLFAGLSRDESGDSPSADDADS